MRLSANSESSGESAHMSVVVCEYDQEILQSHTADQPTAPWGRATEHLSKSTYSGAE